MQYYCHCHSTRVLDIQNRENVTIGVGIDKAAIDL